MGEPAAPGAEATEQHWTDHQRLVRVAERRSQDVVDACHRVGLKPGDRAIDVGCGPLGALPELAEIVGPSGAVLGLDANASALEQAQRTISQLGFGNVTLAASDINTAAVDSLCPPGPFDLAFCRLFLMHQTDPAATLRKIATLLRPGGHVVAQELLDDPRFPTFDPPVPATERVLTLGFELMRRTGRSPDAARRLSEICDEAGLKLVSQRGFFPIVDPYETLEHVRDMLVERRRALLSHGLTTRDELASLLESIQNAKKTQFRSHVYALSIEMVAQKPSQVHG